MMWWIALSPFPPRTKVWNDCKAPVTHTTSTWVHASGGYKKRVIVCKCAQGRVFAFFFHASGDYKTRAIVCKCAQGRVFAFLLFFFVCVCVSFSLFCVFCANLCVFFSTKMASKIIKKLHGPAYKCAKSAFISFAQCPLSLYPLVRFTNPSDRGDDIKMPCRASPARKVSLNNPLASYGAESHRNPQKGWWWCQVWKSFRNPAP